MGVECRLRANTSLRVTATTSYAYGAWWPAGGSWSCWECPPLEESGPRCCSCSSSAPSSPSPRYLYLGGLGSGEGAEEGGGGIRSMLLYSGASSSPTKKKRRVRTTDCWKGRSL